MKLSASRAAAVRSRLSFANLMSMTAVFIALGGGAYAAVKANSVGSRQIKPNAVKTADIAGNAVTSPKVADGSLLAADFATGQIPAGATGPPGPEGERGPTGTVDTSSFYDKTASDARFLGVGATASDSSALGGISEASYPSTTRDVNIIAQTGTPKLGFARRSLPASTGSTAILNIGLLGAINVACSAGSQPSITYRNSQGTAEDLMVQDMVSGAFQPYVSLAAGATSGAVAGASTIGGTSRFNFIVGSGATTGTSKIAVFDVTTVTSPGGSGDCLVQVQSQSYVS